MKVRWQLLVTLSAIALTGWGTIQVIWDFAELQQVQAANAEVEMALKSDDLTPIGTVLLETEALQARLRATAAEQALTNQLQEHWRAVSLLVQSAVPVDQATTFIEERQYARARELAETMSWLVANAPPEISTRENLARDASLRFFEDIEGHILLRQFRATLDNRSLVSLAEQIRLEYPNLYADSLELFLSRAEQKYRNGVALEASGDLEGARQSYEVASRLVPSDDQYATSLEALEQTLAPAGTETAPLP